MLVTSLDCHGVRKLAILTQSGQGGSLPTRKHPIVSRRPGCIQLHVEGHLLETRKGPLVFLDTPYKTCLTCLLLVCMNDRYDFDFVQS